MSKSTYNGEQFRMALDSLHSQMRVVLILTYGGTYWVQRWSRREALKLSRKLRDTERDHGPGPDSEVSIEYTSEGWLGIHVVLP